MQTVVYLYPTKKIGLEEKNKSHNRKAKTRQIKKEGSKSYCQLFDPRQSSGKRGAKSLLQ